MGLSGLDATMMVVGYLIAGVTVGFHRYRTHGSFKARRSLRISPGTALMPFRMRRQQRLSEVPQRIRAVLLHVVHTRSTNDLELQQPQTTHGLKRSQRLAVIL
ncbi:hypothetical protein [Actinoplanes subtropicus]|uniref:hypothetical protein n=1 Tax=Actinoplanes subtropicus TaxID=543632 RepID=UPI0004C3C638|nr:hypothetical protein [Actinoplanes subtropicus]